MRKNLLILSILLIYSILILSCKKEEDTNIPQIAITSPNEFSNFDINDTVCIIAKVIDDKNIASVEIVICNTNYLPVSEKITLIPNTKSIDILEYITIDDFNLPSGTYYVKIRAFDGTNEKNLYRAINIAGIQRKFKNITTINQINANLFQIYSVDTFNNLLFSYSGNFSYSALNNNYQQLYLCGNVNSNLETYNLQNNTLAWSFSPDNNPPFPSFENLYFDNNILYVSYSKAFVKGYNRFSNINFIAQTLSGYTPKKTFRFKNYLIVEEKNNTSNIRLLNLYYYPTGTLKNSTNLSFIIKSMFYKDNDRIYVFGNDVNNNAKMTWFEVENQTFYSPHSMPSGELKDITKIDNTNYLLIIGNKIYWYQEITNSLTVFKDNILANHIDFEDISQTIIISYNNVLTYFSYPSAIKIGEHSMPFNISDFKLLYNKDK